MTAARRRFPIRQTPVRHRQQGAAAVEFALTLTALIAMLLAIAGFSFLVWAQQVFVRMASEGAQVARMAVQQGEENPAGVAARVEAYLERLKEEAPVVKGLFESSTYRALPCAGLAGVQCAEVSVTGDLSAWPLLNLLAGAFAVLDRERDTAHGTLRARAVIVVPSH